MPAQFAISIACEPQLIQIETKQQCSHLGAAVVSRRLADIEQPGALPDQVQDVVRHQPVVEHQVRRLDGADRLEREQLGVPGPRAHQSHPTGPAAAVSALGGPPPGRPQRVQQPPQLRQLQRDLVVPAARRRGSGRGSGGIGGGRGCGAGGAVGGVGPGVAAVARGGGGLGEGRGADGGGGGGAGAGPRVRGGGGEGGRGGCCGRGNGGRSRLEARRADGESHGDAGAQAADGLSAAGGASAFYTGAADQDQLSVREGLEGKRREGGGTKGCSGQEETPESRRPLAALASWLALASVEGPARFNELNHWARPPGGGGQWW